MAFAHMKWSIKSWSVFNMQKVFTWGCGSREAGQAEAVRNVLFRGGFPVTAVQLWGCTMLYMKAAQALWHLSRCLHWPPKDSSCKLWQEELVLADIQTSTSLLFQHNPPKESNPGSSWCLLDTRTDFSWNAHSNTCWHPAPRQRLEGPHLSTAHLPRQL